MKVEIAENAEELMKDFRGEWTAKPNAEGAKVTLVPENIKGIIVTAPSCWSRESAIEMKEKIKAEFNCPVIVILDCDCTPKG